MGAGNQGLNRTKKISYLQYEERAVYTTIPSTFYTGRDLHSLTANKSGVKYVNTWVRSR
jgi:hypothetical protein